MKHTTDGKSPIMIKHVYWFLCLAAFWETLIGSDPSGHMKALGSNTVPKSIEQIEGFPTPWDFYSRYVEPGEPVLFKSVLNDSYPVYTRWNDEYLEKIYGEEMIEAEKGKKETRKGDTSSLSLKDFLKIYKKQDVYMVQDIFSSMTDEVMVPRSLHCGGFQKYFEKAIIWFSSGGTKSVLHDDTVDNINCLLDGTKDLLILDKKYADRVMAHGFNHEEGYSTVDVDNVDMYTFPNLQDLPWFKVKMEPGDCLYIPFGWWHQVNSFGSRNIAINLWFSRLYWFNMTDCDAIGTLKPVEPFSKFGFVSGLERTRDSLLSTFAELKSNSKETFIETLTKGEREKREEVFQFLDKNRDSALSEEECYSFDVEEFVKRFIDYLVLPDNFDEFGDVEKLLGNQDYTSEEMEAGAKGHSRSSVDIQNLDDKKARNPNRRDEF